MGIQSFFEKLTGSQEAEDFLEEERPETKISERKNGNGEKKDWLYAEPEGQLTIDVYQTPKEFVIQSIVAGVKPEELDISINNEMVTIRGERKRENASASDDYIYQELYWGAFSRSILLPSEIDASKADAAFKNGVLTIRLPKIDREKVQKIKIKYKEE